MSLWGLCGAEGTQGSSCCPGGQKIVTLGALSAAQTPKAHMKRLAKKEWRELPGEIRGGVGVCDDFLSSGTA